MSTHPNAILLLVLTPDDLARKTYREILKAEGREVTECISIAGDEYYVDFMEGDYNEGMQISAPEGSIVVYDFLTYGYGECVEWAKLLERQKALEAWAEGVCERHHCSAEFFVTANYW